MSYRYGIGICETVLTYLSSDVDIKSRLAKAFSEFRVMKVKEDLPPDLHSEFIALTKEYYSKMRTDDVSSPKDFADDLVSHCVRIIEYNSLNEREALPRP